MQGAPFESELEYLAYGCQEDPLVQSAVLSFKEQTALQVGSSPCKCALAITVCGVASVCDQLKGCLLQLRRWLQMSC